MLLTYLREINRVPLLTADQEKEIATVYRTTEDKAEREKAR